MKQIFTVQVKILKNQLIVVILRVQLDYVDFGKSRKKHNNICNQLLLKQLEELNKEGIQLCTEVNNEELISYIHLNPQKKPHTSLVWEHCHTQTVIGGLKGIMRLVPQEQHDSRSEHWRTFHPDHKNRGGYHEWAVPRGAPLDKPKNYPPDLKTKQISELKSEELPASFLVAVKTNKLDKFGCLLRRAKQLSISEQELQTILTKPYATGAKGKIETLLHLAAANGNMDFINVLTNYFTKPPNFLQTINYQGNTAAHVAAENNRPFVLRKLKSLGADLNIKNKKQETVYSIVKTRGYSICLPYSQSTTITDSHGNEPIRTEQKQGIAAKPFRDPQFVYGNKVGKQSVVAQITNTQAPSQETFSPAPRKTYKELMKFAGKKDAQDIFQESSVPAPRRTYTELMKFARKRDAQDIYVNQKSEIG